MNIRCLKCLRPYTKMEYIDMDRSFFNDIDLEILFNINYYSMNYFAYEKCQVCYIKN